MSLFIFGYGYSSKAIMHALTLSGWDKAQIHVTTRTDKKVLSYQTQGLNAYIFDGSQDTQSYSSEFILAFKQATHLLISIAPNETGDVVLNHFGDLFEKMTSLTWIGYLSTVGVYGNHDGAWVDETTAPRPKSQRSHQRLAAEQDWQILADKLACPLAIFRLSGIYGPGRSVIEKLKAGTARRIIKQGQVFNRIHVHDIGRFVAHALQHNINGLYNLTDDRPAPPQDVVAYAAEILNMDPPLEVSFENADLSPMGRSFYGENKRVSNAKIKQDFGIEMSYPDYKIALKTMV